MQTVHAAADSFLPRGLLQKGFFVFGLFAAVYFSFQQAKVLFASQDQQEQVVRKKNKSKRNNIHSFAQGSSFSKPSGLSKGTMSSFSYSLPASEAPAVESAPNPDAQASPADPALAANSEAVPAIEGEQQITDINAPLIHSGVPYTGPAATDFQDSQIVGPKPAQDPNALQQDVPQVGLMPPQQNGSAAGGSVGYGYGSSYGSQNNAVPVSLLSQDISILTSRPFTAMVDESMMQSTGTSCTQQGACTQNMQLNLSNNRWNKDHGIKNAGTTFSAQGAANSVRFNVHFVVQSASGNDDRAVDLVLNPLDSNSTEQVQNGVTFKTYEFNFADSTAAGEAIRQLKLVLVYQKAANQQNYVLSAGSELSFVRSGFETVAQPWITGSQNPISSSEAILKPDAQKFSVKLQ